MLRLACVAACVAAVAGELLAAKKAPAPPAAHVYNKPKEDFVRAPYMQLEGSRKLDCEGCKRITRKVCGSGRSATRRSAAMACWCLPTVCQVNAEASSPQGLSPGCLLRLPLATRSTIHPAPWLTHHHHPPHAIFNASFCAAGVRVVPEAAVYQPQYRVVRCSALSSCVAAAADSNHLLRFRAGTTFVSSRKRRKASLGRRARSPQTWFRSRKRYVPHIRQILAL